MAVGAAGGNPAPPSPGRHRFAESGRCLFVIGQSYMFGKVEKIDWETDK